MQFFFLHKKLLPKLTHTNMQFFISINLVLYSQFLALFSQLLVQAETPSDFNSDSNQNYSQISTTTTFPITSTTPPSIWDRKFELPDITPKTIELTYNNQHLSFLYKMANGFVYLILNPFKNIEELLQKAITDDDKYWNYFEPYYNQTKGTLSQGDGNLPGRLFLAYKIMNFETGYLVCLGIGISFSIAMPIIGLCFCSCRLCNHCGGRMYQDIRMSRSNWRPIYCCSSFFVTILLIFSNFCIFFTNLWLSEAVNLLPEQTNHLIDSIENYVNGTIDQKTYLQDLSFNLTDNFRNETEKIGSSLVLDILSAYEIQARNEYQNFKELEPKLGQLVKDKTGDLSVINDKICNLQKIVKGLEEKFLEIQNLLEKELGKIKDCRKECQRMKLNLKDLVFEDEDNLNLRNVKLLYDEILDIKNQFTNHGQIFEEFKVASYILRQF